MNLNNRIYFRDHQPPGHGDSVDIVSDRVCATAQTSLRFAISEPDSFQLRSITRTVELGIGEGDHTMVNSSLVSSIFRSSCFCIPMSLDDSGSLSSPALQNAVCILMTLSQWSTISLLLVVNRTTCTGCATATEFTLRCCQCASCDFPLVCSRDWQPVYALCRRGKCRLDGHM